MDIPIGFANHDRSSPVTDAWSPLLARWSDTACEIGFILAKQHCNARDMLHGGVIAALADNAMGLSLGKCWFVQVDQSEKPSIVTTNLAVDYFAPAKLGAWIQISPTVVNLGRKSGTVTAIVTADDVVIARANATFRIM